MTGDLDIRIEGFDELQRLLKKTPEKVTRRELIKIMRRVGKPVLNEIRSELPNQTGTLKNSFRFFTKKNRDFPGVAIGPAMRGKFFAPHWYLSLYGSNVDVRPAVTNRTSRKTKTVRTERGVGRVVRIGGIYTVVYDTGNMEGNNVVEKVFARVNRQMLVSQNKSIEKYIQKTIKRLSK